MSLVSRIIYLIGGIIVTMLGIRLLLVLLGASAASPLVDFVYRFTQPFVSPFFGMFNYNPSFGASRFEFGTLIAIVVYSIATGIVGALLGSRPRTTY